MVMWGLSKEALDDPFRPPPEACLVFCLHCQQVYSSDDIVWREEDGRGFWCCPVPGCGGMGFGFDIHPVEDGDEIDEEDWDEDWEEGEYDEPEYEEGARDGDADDDVPW